MGGEVQLEEVVVVVAVVAVVLVLVLVVSTSRRADSAQSWASGTVVVLFASSE